MKLTSLAAGAALAGLLASATPASAALTLTQAGIDAGFSLSTFVGGYPFGAGNYGPLSQAVNSQGHVVTGSVSDGRMYVFNDADNQTLGSAVASSAYSCQTANCNYALAGINGNVYGAQLFGGIYEQIADDGTRTAMAGAVSGIRGYLGMWSDPTTNHIFASSNVGLVNINPLDGSFSVINASLFPDGVSLSNDGTTLYVENGGTVQSYNAVTGVLIHTYFTGHQPDGTGVISGGAYNGQVIVNNNDGTIGLLNPLLDNSDPNQLTIIAAGGTRGDFVSPDRTNGTLFMSELDAVYRLSCGQNCAIGSTSGAPEPSAWALMLMGFGGLGMALRSRRRRRAGVAA